MASSLSNLDISEKDDRFIHFKQVVMSCGDPGVELTCANLTAGDCLLIGCLLVNTYAELQFRSNQRRPIVLFRNNFIFICLGYFFEIS